MPDFAFHANPDIGLMHGFSFSKTSIIVIAKTLTKICTKDGFLFKEDSAVAFKHVIYLVNFWHARFCFSLKSKFNLLIDVKIVKRRKHSYWLRISEKLIIGHCPMGFKRGKMRRENAREKGEILTKICQHEPINP